MSLPHFECLSRPTELKGLPHYVLDDYAFDFQVADETEATARKGKAGTTSLILGTLQMEVSIESNLCLYVWGYCPFMKWKALAVAPPSSQAGALQVAIDRAFTAGVSVGIEEMISPTPHFNPNTGWFCMGNSETPDDSLVIEFATDTLAAVQAGRLLSLWVKPHNWGDVARRLSWA